MDQLTAWELMAAVNGWRAANGGEDEVSAPTPDEFDAIMAKHGG